MKFDNAVRRLYFGVDIQGDSNKVINSLKKVNNLEYNESDVRQWNLNISLIMGKEDDSWSSSHEFSFSKSPIPDLKIRSGKITVTLGETVKLQKVIKIDWITEFENKSDAKVFYDKLINIFTPLSTKHKEEYDKLVGHMVQFATLDEQEKGIRDVFFCLGKSAKTKRYQITTSIVKSFLLE